uniref:Uncharacterized protein n=1 Tax=Anguilla anguilla TaxID=7936 RepID=A0A0E9UAH3_ANGAN
MCSIKIRTGLKFQIPLFPPYFPFVY